MWRQQGPMFREFGLLFQQLQERAVQGQLIALVRQDL